MVKPLLAIALLASLTGCAHTRYIRTSCVTPEQYEKLKQAEPPKVASKLTGKADEDVRVLGGSAVRLRAWGDGLLGVLGGCAAPIDAR